VPPPRCADCLAPARSAVTLPGATDPVHRILSEVSPEVKLRGGRIGERSGRRKPGEGRSGRRGRRAGHSAASQGQDGPRRRRLQRLTGRGSHGRRIALAIHGNQAVSLPKVSGTYFLRLGWIPGRIRGASFAQPASRPPGPARRRRPHRFSHVPPGAPPPSQVPRGARCPVTKPFPPGPGRDRIPIAPRSSGSVQPVLSAVPLAHGRRPAHSWGTTDKTLLFVSHTECTWNRSLKTFSLQIGWIHTRLELGFCITTSESSFNALHLAADR